MMTSTGRVLSSRWAPTISPAISVAPPLTMTRMLARRAAMTGPRVSHRRVVQSHAVPTAVQTVTDTDDDGLVRVLGLGSGVLFVLGSVIGSGIFLTTGGMAATLPSETLLLTAWAAGGLLALAGGLTYAELGSMFPKSGGVYVYLREAF